MNKKAQFLTFLCVLTASATLLADPVGPKIQFEKPIYDFEKVKSGEMVKYTYIFTNTGDSTLFVTNVQPSCGCTTAGDWTHQVEPGQTGTVPVQFNSANYGGMVVKQVTVTSNDKQQPSVVLQLKGTIWKPVDVNPNFAVLNVSAESTANTSTTVHIINNMDEPLILSTPEVNNKAFTAELKTNEAGKNFELTIKVAPPADSGNLQGMVTVKTSSTNFPVVSVSAWANVQPVIVVSPPQISLPVGPLTAKQTVSIMIQNNGTNAITVSEPTIGLKGVEAQVSESQAGKLFTATVTFPEGFELPQGTLAELTVKSTHPRFPLIKVPVSQAARAAFTPIPHPTVIPLPPAAAGRENVVKRVLLESVLVAALGVLIAFGANALSPHGLKLGRDYFPGD